MPSDVKVGLVLTLPFEEGHATYYCYVEEPVDFVLLTDNPTVKLRFSDDNEFDIWSHTFDLEGRNYWQTPEGTKSLFLMVPLKLEGLSDQQLEKLRTALDEDDDWLIDE